MKTVTLIKFVEEKATVLDLSNSIDVSYLHVADPIPTTDGKWMISDLGAPSTRNKIVSPVHQFWNRQEFRRSAIGYISEDSDDRFVSETKLEEDHRTGNRIKESVAYIAYDLHSSPYLMNMFNLLLDKQHEQLKAENRRLQNSVQSLESYLILRGNQIVDYESRIEKIKNASFLTRLKWVFTGIK